DPGAVVIAVGADVQAVAGAALLGRVLVAHALLGQPGGEVGALGLQHAEAVGLAGLLGVDLAVVGLVLRHRGVLQAAELLHVDAAVYLWAIGDSGVAVHAVLQAVGLVVAGVGLVDAHVVQGALLPGLDDAAVVERLDGGGLVQRALLVDQGAVVAAVQFLAHAGLVVRTDRKSTRLNSSHVKISYDVFFLQIKK